jgi:dihydrofolate synthase/folylpolyglutamate synthase
MAGLDDCAIAREKAGILRRGGTLITLPQHPEANQVLGEVATELGRARSERGGLYAGDGRGMGSYIREALGEAVEVASPLPARTSSEMCAGHCGGC